MDGRRLCEEECLEHRILLPVDFPAQGLHVSAGDLRGLNTNKRSCSLPVPVSMLYVKLGTCVLQVQGSVVGDESCM